MVAGHFETYSQIKATHERGTKTAICEWAFGEQIDIRNSMHLSERIPPF